jgi:hypothetical protein
MPRLLPRLSYLAAAAVLLSAAASCSRPATGGPPVIRLVPNGDGAAYVELVGVSPADRSALARREPPVEDWQRALVVSVKAAGEPIAIAGTYHLTGHAIQFTPRFPFDPGREYEVRYHPGVLAGATPAGAPVTAIVSLPALPEPPPVAVTGVYPSAESIPENQLRLYIHFSAPMGRHGGLPYVRLIDEGGRIVDDPFLPLDADFWDADRTRYTVFFDPGRQKRGILPNREMGRSLIAGRSYTLEVSRDWPDAHGRPLRETYTRRFRVVPAVLDPIEPASWTVIPPEAGTRSPLIVRFPRALDHGLLTRAIGVRRNGGPVTGDVQITDHETAWTLTPAAAWEEGAYDLVALPILEDASGNRIGRAFEIVRFARGEDAPDQADTLIPFRIRNPAE